MKNTLIILLALLVLAGAIYLFAFQDGSVAPTVSPTVSVTPTATSTATASPSPSGSKTPTPSPTGTPFTSANVRVTTPRPNQVINSPLTIRGEARGTWFFEASFPIRLLDANNNVIATGIAQAQSEWMTTNFVPFEAIMVFTKPSSNTGKLVFEKDNPSGLPENDASVEFPIRFR